MMLQALSNKDLLSDRSGQVRHGKRTVRDDGSEVLYGSSDEDILPHLKVVPKELKIGVLPSTSRHGGSLDGKSRVGYTSVYLYIDPTCRGPSGSMGGFIAVTGVLAAHPHSR